MGLFRPVAGQLYFLLIESIFLSGTLIIQTSLSITLPRVWLNQFQDLKSFSARAVSDVCVFYCLSKSLVVLLQVSHSPWRSWVTVTSSEKIHNVLLALSFNLRTAAAAQSKMNFSVLSFFCEKQDEKESWGFFPKCNGDSEIWFRAKKFRQQPSSRYVCNRRTESFTKRMTSQCPLT